MPIPVGMALPQVEFGKSTKVQVSLGATIGAMVGSPAPLPPANPPAVPPPTLVPPALPPPKADPPPAISPPPALPPPVFPPSMAVPPAVLAFTHESKLQTWVDWHTAHSWPPVPHAVLAMPPTHSPDAVQQPLHELGPHGTTGLQASNKQKPAHQKSVFMLSANSTNWNMFYACTKNSACLIPNISRIFPVPRCKAAHMISGRMSSVGGCGGTTPKNLILMSLGMATTKTP